MTDGFRVAELWRYPVKSLGGEQLDATAIGEHGIPGDRAYGILDVATGKVLTARREPGMLFASASWHDGEVEIVVDGEVLATDRDLSEWIGRPVRLVRAGSEGGVYENPTDFEQESDWASWQGPGQAWHDSTRTRVSLVSRSTLRDWDLRRFRANVLLQDGAGEDALVGHEVQLGTAVLDVKKQIDRCVMVTRPQPGVPADLDVLRTIHRERGGCLAIGALVTETGHVAIGDHLARRGALAR